MPFELIIGSPWTYAIIMGSIAGSAVFPPLPSESMLVTAMSLAVSGELSLTLVCVAAAVAALLGDLAAYTLGRILSKRIHNRAVQSARGKAALDWLQDHEQTWGPTLVVVSRFIPGGTTAVGISAGLLTYPLRWFVPFAALGVVLWTIYGLAIATLGHAVFPNNFWANIALAIGIALGTGALVHLVRQRRRRQR